MINSVQNIKQIEQNLFADFKSKGAYYLTPKTANDIYETGERKKEEKSNKTGWVIASTALFTAVGIFALMKGLPKNTYKKLGEWAKKLEVKVNRRKASGETGPITSFYKYSLKKLNSFSEKAKGVNNIVSFKDLLFMRLMEKTKLTRKIHFKITSLFEKLGRKTVNRNYKSTRKSFEKLFDNYAAMRKKIALTDSNNPVIKEALLREEKIKAELLNGFGKNKILGRYKQMKKGVAGLDKKVWDASFGDAGNFKGKDVYQSFIAENALSADKLALKANVSKLRDTVAAKIAENTNIYKEILPKAEFDKINKMSKSALKKLDKSINTETNEFFDKLRDLKLGSAPTDVMSVVGSAGVIGYGLSMADDKDERMSILLKYGIPVIGAVTTSLALTASLIAGAKAMIYGSLSGLVMGDIGSRADKARKKYNKQKEDYQHAREIKSEINNQNA